MPSFICLTTLLIWLAYDSTMLFILCPASFLYSAVFLYSRAVTGKAPPIITGFYEMGGYIFTLFPIH